MRILVTGGAGYIGSHTVLALLDAGDDVLIGGGGNDTLIAGNRRASLEGGDGNDLLRSSPDTGRSRKASSRSRVDFPQPLGPVRATASPLRTSSRGMSRTLRPP